MPCSASRRTLITARLNLAQAVQLLAYDLRQAVGGFGVQARTPDPGAGLMRAPCKVCWTICRRH